MPSTIYRRELPGREINIGKYDDWTRRRSWLVFTDTRAYDEGQLLLDGISGGTFPTPYLSTHPDDARFLCKRLAGKQDTRSPLHWRVTADYDTKPWDNDDEENPLDRRTKVSWSTVKYQKAIEKDRDGEAILNSAGDYFDPPPLKDVSRWTATITKNLDAIPTAIFDYPDAINDADWTLQGITIPQHTAKIIGIQISDLQKEGDVEFYTFTYTVEFDSVHQWKGKYLNQGYYYLTDPAVSPRNRKRCRVDGRDSASPQLLDGDGQQIADPSPSNATFEEYDVETELNFSVLPTPDTD